MCHRPSLPGFYLRNKAERPAAILARLQDLGERRIADMDAAGIDRQIISLTCPGTQILDRDRRRCGPAGIQPGLAGRPP